MQYTIETIINTGRDKIWRYFDDPEAMKRWQPTLQSHELLEGEAGQPGAVSRLVYDENGYRVELTETIISRDEPEIFVSTYEVSGVMHTVTNHLEALNENQTNWIMVSDLDIKSRKLKLMAPMINKIMKQRTENYIEHFKAVVEDE